MRKKGRKIMHTSKGKELLTLESGWSLSTAEKKEFEHNRHLSCRWASCLVFTVNQTQTRVTWEREPQFRDCPNHGAVSEGLVDLCGKAQPTCPRQEDLGEILKLIKHELRSGQGNNIPPWLLLQFPLEFLSWLPSVIDCVLGILKWNKPCPPHVDFGHRD